MDWSRIKRSCTGSRQGDTRGEGKEKEIKVLLNLSGQNFRSDVAGEGREQVGVDWEVT